MHHPGNQPRNRRLNRLANPVHALRIGLVLHPPCSQVVRPAVNRQLFLAGSHRAVQVGIPRRCPLGVQATAHPASRRPIHLLVRQLSHPAGLAVFRPFSRQRNLRFGHQLSQHVNRRRIPVHNHRSSPLQSHRRSLLVVPHVNLQGTQQRDRVQSRPPSLLLYPHHNQQPRLLLSPQADQRGNLLRGHQIVRQATQVEYRQNNPRSCHPPSLRSRRPRNRQRFQAPNLPADRQVSPRQDRQLGLRANLAHCQPFNRPQSRQLSQHRVRVCSQLRTPLHGLRENPPDSRHQDQLSVRRVNPAQSLQTAPLRVLRRNRHALRLVNQQHCQVRNHRLGLHRSPQRSLLVVQLDNPLQNLQASLLRLLPCNPLLFLLNSRRVFRLHSPPPIHLGSRLRRQQPSHRPSPQISPPSNLPRSHQALPVMFLPCSPQAGPLDNLLVSPLYFQHRVQVPNQHGNHRLCPLRIHRPNQQHFRPRYQHLCLLLPLLASRLRSHPLDQHRSLQADLRRGQHHNPRRSQVHSHRYSQADNLHSDRPVSRLQDRPLDLAEFLQLSRHRPLLCNHPVSQQQALPRNLPDYRVFNQPQSQQYNQLNSRLHSQRTNLAFHPHRSLQRSQLCNPVLHQADSQLLSLHPYQHILPQCRQRINQLLNRQTNPASSQHNNPVDSRQSSHREGHLRARVPSQRPFLVGSHRASPLRSHQCSHRCSRLVSQPPSQAANHRQPRRCSHRLSQRVSQCRIQHHSLLEDPLLNRPRYLLHNHRQNRLAFLLPNLLRYHHASRHRSRPGCRPRNHQASQRGHLLASQLHSRREDPPVNLPMPLVDNPRHSRQGPRPVSQLVNLQGNPRHNPLGVPPISLPPSPRGNQHPNPRDSPSAIRQANQQELPPHNLLDSPRGNPLPSLPDSRSAIQRDNQRELLLDNRLDSPRDNRLRSPRGSLLVILPANQLECLHLSRPDSQRGNPLLNQRDLRQFNRPLSQHGSRLVNQPDSQ
jgi:hypothetical protein